LEYLELSVGMNISDDLLTKCSQKFKVMVIFGCVEIPQARLQGLSSGFMAQLEGFYAREFPVNLKVTKKIT